MKSAVELNTFHWNSFVVPRGLMGGETGRHANGAAYIRSFMMAESKKLRLNENVCFYFENVAIIFAINV